MRSAPGSSWELWTYMGGAAFCVLCAAMAAGLTVGLMSLDPLELEVKRRVGTEKERAMASRVCPLIRRHHLLLVTLLLFNSIANETLPLFLDRLVPSYLAVILSVSVVLVFGEIIPSALFSGPNQLRIASNLASFVYALMALFYPIAGPLAWILDRCLGQHGLKRYTREELSMLVEVQREVQAVRRKHGGHASGYVDSSDHKHRPITRDEATIVAGVLKCHHKKVRDAMKPIEEVYMVSMEEIMDEDKLCELLATGFSRVPVHSSAGRYDIRGFLLVKRLIVIDPEDGRPVHTLPLRRPIVVSPEESLLELINIFQEGRSHMAIVSEHPEVTKKALATGEPHSGPGTPIGIITLEDLFEEILQEEIYDEVDMQEKNALAALRRIRKEVKSAIAKATGRRPNKPDDVEHFRLLSIAGDGLPTPERKRHNKSTNGTGEYKACDAGAGSSVNSVAHGDDVPV